MAPKIDKNKVWTMADVQAAKEKGRVILLIEGGVYDVTTWHKHHPGSSNILTDSNGNGACRVDVSIPLLGSDVIGL